MSYNVKHFLASKITVIPFVIEWASALVPPTPLFGGCCREREREGGRDRERAWWKLLRGIWRVLGVLSV